MIAYDLYSQDLNRISGPLDRSAEAAATRDELVTANLRFAFSVAIQYEGRGVEREDLIQAANMGLIKAAEKFDPTRGLKFITYAVWWIRQEILRAVEDPDMVHLPYSQRHRGTRLYLESLDEPVENALDGESRKDRVVDEGPRPDLAVEEAEACAFVGAQLERLNDSEREILRLFFGLDCREHTLADIGRRMGLSKERVRQKKEAALVKLWRGSISESEQLPLEV